MCCHWFTVCQSLHLWLIIWVDSSAYKNRTMSSHLKTLLNNQAEQLTGRYPSLHIIVFKALTTKIEHTSSIRIKELDSLQD